MWAPLEERRCPRPIDSVAPTPDHRGPGHFSSPKETKLAFLSYFFFFFNYYTSNIRWWKMLNGKRKKTPRLGLPRDDEGSRLGASLPQFP